MTHSIRVEAGESGRVIVASGEFDSTAAPSLDEALRGACEAEQGQMVVLDLTDAEFIDSRTMSVLIAWTERQRGTGASLPIVCPNPNLMRVFRQIGLDETLQLVESRSEIPGLA